MSAKSRVSIDDNVSFTQYLSFTGVQSAANAFLQVVVPTNVVPNSEFILDIKEIVVSIDAVPGSNSFAPQFAFSLTRASKAAIPNMTDPDIIAKGALLGVGGGAFTAGTNGIVEIPFNVPFTGKQIIATPNVYFQFLANGFAAAATISGRIYYDQLNMSKDRILEILYG
jgi:hypothetical protein